jgi:hypothetical protein
VTFTELRGVKEATADPNGDTSEGISLSAGLVSLTATVTDNDLDQKSASIDLGPQITIHDDGPVQGAIQNAIMPSVNNTDAHGTWQPAFGADGLGTNAISISMPGQAPTQSTFTDPFGGHDTVYTVTETGTGPNGPFSYSFYEYSFYDPTTHTTTLYAFGDTALTAGFFTLTMGADGLYDYHLINNTLQQQQTFLSSSASPGPDGWIAVLNDGTLDQPGKNATSATYPSSGTYSLILDGFDGIAHDINSHDVSFSSSGGSTAGAGIDNNVWNGLDHLNDANSGETFDLVFGQSQSSVSMLINKGTPNATLEHFHVWIFDASHPIGNFAGAAQEDIFLPVGQSITIDSTHWGVGSAGTATSGPAFYNFTEMWIENVAANGTTEDSSITLAGITYNGQQVIGSTSLGFTPTITDGDGDSTTGSTFTVSLNGSTNASGGYDLTGTSAPEVLVASAGPDNITGGTGPGAPSTTAIRRRQ